MITADRELLDAAHAWWELGLTPMSARNKRPLARAWQTLDPAEHLRRIEAEPPEQIGLRMGHQRDDRWLVAIDIDGLEGEDSIQRLAGELGMLPTTAAQRTPHGGRHLIFEWPRELASQCPTTSTGKLGPRIDIRGERGHIVAAPSPGADGGHYALLDDEAPIEVLPDEWVQRIIETHRAPEPAAAPPPRSGVASTDAFERARRYVERMDPAISGSGGHRATWRVAQVVVRGFALGYAEALDILREFNQRCEPPWTERELSHKVESAVTRSRMPRGCLLDPGRAQPAWHSEWDTDAAERAAIEAEPSVEQSAPASQAPGGENWRDLLSMTPGSKRAPPVPRKCVENVLTTLRHCPEWKGVLAHNEFDDRVGLRRAPPRAAHHGEHIELGQWRDGYAIWAIAWFHEQLGFEPSFEMVSRAVDEVARENTYHPVRDWLRSLQWDRRPRCDRMLSEIFGAEDNQVNRIIGSKWLISAVARVMRPGCQADHLLILEGPQGSRKSTAFRTLVGDQWFCNSALDLRSKDAAIALRGCLVYEFDELDAFRGRDVQRIKSFLTLRADDYRPPYEARSRKFPRQCVFAGSTNESQYLSDPTGNRRFWPVRCGAIDVPRLVAERDQLWAEANARYCSAEPWHVESLGLVEQLREAQSAREEVDPWQGPVAQWWAELHEGRQRQGVTTSDVFASVLELKLGHAERRDEMRVAACLRRLGLERRQVMHRGARSWRYCPQVVQEDFGQTGGAGGDCTTSRWCSEAGGGAGGAQ